MSEPRQTKTYERATQKTAMGKVSVFFFHFLATRSVRGSTYRQGHCAPAWIQKTENQEQKFEVFSSVSGDPIRGSIIG